MSDSIDISVAEAKEIVLRIGQGNGWVDPELRAAATTDPESRKLLEIIEEMRENFGHLVEAISRDIYSQRNRFILELIQNAEDCQFSRTNTVPSLSFDVQPGKVVFESNEDGFTGNDVRQISRLGKSWKRQERGYVGEKGIGFKSIFQVASKVHIQSNSFSFHFEYHGDGTIDDKFGLVTPIWQDSPVPVDDQPLTRMTFTPNDAPYNELVAYFTEIPSTLLLFLSKIASLEVKIHRPEHGTTIKRFSVSGGNATNLARLTTSFENVDGRIYNNTSIYHIFRKLVSDLPGEEARPGINECEAVLAFPVDNLDCPLRATEYDIFAFLPVNRIGLNFLIQADFILQANREEISFDLDWNKALLPHIVECFCNAVLNFCARDTPLRYQWVKYLPHKRDLERTRFWKGIHAEIIERLQREAILFSQEGVGLCPPGQLRTLPPTYLDRDGSPLFRDLTGRRREYLSLEYHIEDIEALKRAFNILELTDLAMCQRITRDLNSVHSRMKSDLTDDDWHSRAANLILSIIARSLRGDGVRPGTIETMPLIPLSDRRWLRALDGNLYFPSETGPPIPHDLVVTICPRATRNNSRKLLFERLGATHCALDTVVNRLFQVYVRTLGAFEGAQGPDLESSKAHLSYLYWNYENVVDRRFQFLWVYNSSGNKVTPRRHTLYLPSEDEYSPQQLFKPVRSARRGAPGLSVPFLNFEYMNLFSSAVRRNDLSWLDWLKRALAIRNFPRLKYEAGSLSAEFRYLLQNRPDKIVGVLKRYWPKYRAQMNFAIVEEISTSRVECWGSQPTPLKCTYFPTTTLKEEVRNLGISRGFPFLEVSRFPEDEILPEDWRFLERFQVRFEADLNFYLEILIQHEYRRQAPWSPNLKANIISTYELISDYCSARNRAMLIDTFERNSLILHPTSISLNSTGPRWLDIEDCVWGGPLNLLDKTPLALVYSTNPKISRLFHEILDIKTADLNDYKRSLWKLKTKPNPQQNIADNARSLYELISRSDISENDWAALRYYFEIEGLVYNSTTSEWIPPSQCVWSSPIPIDGKVIIGNDYTELRGFFLERLQISPASLATLVEGLRSMSERNPTVVEVKQMIWAVNAMNPNPEGVEILKDCNILPTTRSRGNEHIHFRTCQDTFVLIDRAKLVDVFRDYVEFLDFSLEEIWRLDPFIQALGLSQKFLSKLYTERTACNEDSIASEVLTTEFRDRAYSLLRCILSNRRPIVLESPQLLYDRIAASLVMETDNISTQGLLNHPNGDVTGPVSLSTGYVHISGQHFGWKIFVPCDRRNREVCYRKYLPEALVKLFQLPTSTTEIISHVLNSSYSIIDDLLEATGTIEVPEVEVLSRRTDGGPEEVDVENVTASKRISRPQPTPISAGSGRRTHASSSQVLGRERRASTSVVSALAIANVHSTPTISRELLEPNLLGQKTNRSDNAYIDLLDYVIRMGKNANLPPSDFTAAPINGRFLPGFNHEAAFGIRSMTQMRHDRRIGAAGELFVFEVLLKALPDTFTLNNWRSTIRQEVTVHSDYSDMIPWTGRETADMVYTDTGSNLTALLIQLGYLEEVWNGFEPEYLIEVKTTTRNYSDRFFMSNNQYSLMQGLTFKPGQTSRQIYAIFRVFDLGKESMALKIYVDPEAHRLKNSLLFESQTWTVRPGP